MTIYQKFVNENIKYGNYDFKARKDRRDEGMDKETAKFNLLLFHKILNKYNIKFFLLYGTVLGAIREKDFIAHDTDTDIGILEEERKQFLKAIPELIDNGFELIRTKEPDDLVTFMRNDEYIDIGVFVSNGKYYTYQGNLIDKYFLDKLDSIYFLGESFLIPSNIERFLELTYGSNWKIPLKNEPAMNLGWKNVYYRFKRVFLKTAIGKIIKKIIKKLIGKQ